MTDETGATARDWSQLNSGQISDALERAGLPQTVLHGFARVDGGAGPCFGPAFTIRQTPKAEDTPRAEALVRHGRAVREEVPPGAVIVIDNAGRLDSATWGGNHTRRCAARGIAGAVIFGASRDIEEIAQTRQPVWTTGQSPVKSLWSLRTEAINAPVTVQGVTIRPGDIVFADRTGIVIIPQAAAAEVHAHAEAVRAGELRAAAP